MSVKKDGALSLKQRKNKKANENNLHVSIARG